MWPCVVIVCSSAQLRDDRRIFFFKRLSHGTSVLLYLRFFNVPIERQFPSVFLTAPPIELSYSPAMSSLTVNDARGRRAPILPSLKRTNKLRRAARPNLVLIQTAFPPFLSAPPSSSFRAFTGCSLTQRESSCVHPFTEHSWPSVTGKANYYLA